MSNPHRQTAWRSAGTSGTATPTSGSQTILQTHQGSSLPSATLRLRADPEPRRGIQWAEDVIDNEGMGKKSSKVCCIYHKRREPGDTDSESDSSSSDSDSDSEPDLSRAQRAGGKGKRVGKGHDHDHDHGSKGDGGGKGQSKGKERKPSPNAYERQPKYKSKKEG